jgi:hypothetical protein
MAFHSLTNGTFCSNSWNLLLQGNSFTSLDSAFSLLVTRFTRGMPSRRISHTSSARQGPQAPCGLITLEGSVLWTLRATMVRGHEPARQVYTAARQGVRHG